MEGFMKKILLSLVCLVLLIVPLFAKELQEVIPPEEGMIEYFIFIDGGWGLDDPYSYDWSKGVDSSGDEYVMAVSDSPYYPTIYYFYNLSNDKLDEEYDYWTAKALSLKRDSDNETIGSINDDYIFLKLPNNDRKTFKYGEYIGHKFYFTNYQRIPYTKFNLVWKSGSMVVDY